jgi:hypothetical protein
MKNLMKVLALCAIVAFYGCDSSEKTGKGKASFYLTDGPMEASNVSEVVISISNVEVSGPNGWEIVKEYETPVSINLLELQGGETFFIEEADLTAGDYGQVRLGLAQSIEEMDPAHYIKFTDESITELTIPSGNQTGYKIVGGFTIPDGGVTSVIIDFDVRKSVVKAGNSGKYILKPTLRLLEDSNVGAIEGSIEGDYEGNLVVYAYENGAYAESETEVNGEGIIFANATTSANVNAEANYSLSFLSAGTYDIIVAEFNEQGEFVGIVAEEENVALEAGVKLTVDLEINL